MTKVETMMKTIEERAEANITTKELKEYGLNQHNIKKAIDIGKLVRMERGKYCIVRIQNNKEISEFDKFVANVFQQKFEEAYNHLVADVNL